MKYKIVADSSSNVLEIDKVEYTSVPLKIITNEKEYVDNSALDVVSMVEDLAGYKGKSGTSCPNVYEWMEAFGDADIVFGVSITSNLSGCYNAAMQAKEIYESEHPGAKVHIIDTLSAGTEMELIIEKLQELILAEKSFEEIKKEIDTYVKKTHLLFSLQSLKNLVNNGRVSPAVAAVAGVLGIRIMGQASEEGTLQPLHKCRSEKHVLKTIWNEMQKAGFAGGKVRITHCLNKISASQLKETILEKYKNCDVKITECKGLCAFYLEKGGVMIGFES